MKSFNTNHQNKNILFGDEITYQLKKELLDYLYKNIDIYQLRYSILKTQEHAQQLKQQSLHITTHFHGYNYYLVFKKLLNNKVEAYLIYRIDLKFTRQDTNPNYIKIYKLNINENIDDMDNTIIDGKYIQKKDEKIFLISDIYYYKNEKLLTTKIIDKFDTYKNEIIVLNRFLKNYFDIKFIKLYTNDELYDLVYNKIKNSDYKINGLIFFPQRSGRIFIYINDTEFEQIKSSPNLESQINIPNIKFPSNVNLDKQQLLIQKTLIIDVYEVFTLDKTFRFGICAIPTIELSHKLRNHFEQNEELIIDCIYNNKFSKWMPLI